MASRSTSHQSGRCRSAAISRIRSGSCSAWSVRAASTRNRAKPRSSSAGGPGERERCHLDRCAQRVTTLAEDSHLAALEPGDRHHLVGGLCKRRRRPPADERGAGRRRTGRRRRPPRPRSPCCRCPRATIRPPSRATNTTAAARCALATSFSASRPQRRLARETRSRAGALRSDVDRASGTSTPSTASRKPRSRSSRSRRSRGLIEVRARSRSR